MPMIDVYATAGTFAVPNSLAQQLAETLMRIEEVPALPMFRKNTAAFVHALPDGAFVTWLPWIENTPGVFSIQPLPTPA